MHTLHRRFQGLVFLFFGIVAAPALHAEGSLSRASENPTLSIADKTVSESVGGFRLPIELSTAVSYPVRFVIATRRGSAINPDDFFGSGLTLTIPAGATSATLYVGIANDTLEEPTESFTVQILRSEGADIGRGVATITIEDDDQGALSQFQMEFGPVVNEGDGVAIVTVTLIPAAAEATSVLIATRPGASSPAQPGADYYGIFQKLEFAAGETQKKVSIVILDDEVADERTEFLDVRLFRPSSNAGLIPFRNITDVVILDDDTP